MKAIHLRVRLLNVTHLSCVPKRWWPPTCVRKIYDFFSLKFIFNWRIIAFNIVLVSAIAQYEPAIGIRVYPPLWISLPSLTPSHPSGLSQSTRFELPVSYSKFPLAIYFIHGSIYVSKLPSQFIPPFPSPTVSTSLFSISTSPLLCVLSCSVMSNSLWLHGLQPTRYLSMRII